MRAGSRHLGRGGGTGVGRGCGGVGDWRSGDQSGGRGSRDRLRRFGRRTAGPGGRTRPQGLAEVIELADDG